MRSNIETKDITVILLGPPGSGKGTQAKILSKKLDIIHISTGDILRNAVLTQTTLGKQISGLMQKGELITDRLMIKVINTEINNLGSSNSFILDGFPRTIAQAEAITMEIDIDYVLEIKVSDKEIIDRLGGRRTHPSSGRIYHIKYNPPKVINHDDITGEELITRADDSNGIIRKRLVAYHNQIKPLIKYYQNSSKENCLRYATIDGEQTIEIIHKQIIESLL